MANPRDLSHASDDELFQIAGVNKPDADLSKMSNKELLSELMRINGRLPPEVDLDKLSDDELFYIAGITSLGKSDVSSMSDDELFRIAGIEEPVSDTQSFFGDTRTPKSPEEDASNILFSPSPKPKEYGRLSPDKQTAISTGRQGPGFVERIIPSFMKQEGMTEADRNRAANIYSLSEETGLPLNFVESNYDRITQELGVRGVPTTKEYIDALMTAAIAAGLYTAPLKTAVGVTSFMGAKEAESALTQKLKGEDYKFGEGRELKEFLPPLKEPYSTGVELAEFFGPAAFSGAAISKIGKRFRPVDAKEIAIDRGTEQIGKEDISSNLISRSEEIALKDKGYSQEVIDKITPDEIDKVLSEPSPVKQPWEMTKPEWEAVREGKEIAPENITHEDIVKQALYSGIPVPPEVLKEYPDLQQNTPLGKSVMLDRGGYAQRERITPSMTEQERANYVDRNRYIVELPEIVTIARELMTGRHPAIRKHIKRMGDGILGAFYPGKGKIRLKADIFKDPELAAKVLAHEIGHLADWLPDQTMKRGNILGRVASLKKYMESLLEEYPGAPEGILTDADRARFKAEAERQVRSEVDRPDQEIVREILKEVPKYEVVGITPEMVLDIMRGKVSGKEMAPELYRFLQEAPTAVKKEIVKKALKDIVDERLAQFGERRQVGTEFVTETETEVIRGRKATKREIETRFRELLKDEILRRKLFEKEVITNELKKVGQIWKPFDVAADKKYTAYRHSSKELYADAVSMLLNDPEMLRKEAPTFSKAFFNFLERKPEVKGSYDAIQELVSNPEAVMESRREFTRGMAEKGEAQRKKFAELRESTASAKNIKGMGREIYRWLVDKNKKWIEIERRSLKEGARIRKEDRLSYWMEELPYIDSEVGNYRLQIEKNIFDTMRESDISMIDLHEYMILRRSATERAEMAAPGGIGGEFAKKQLDFMKKKVGPEKFAKIEKLVNDFWQKRNRYVIKVLEEANFLTPELIDYIRNNEEYATFSRLNDLGDRIIKTYGDQASAHIYRQLGTLGEVDNVFVQTVLKDMALIRAGRNHQAKMTLLEHLARYGNEGEITQAKGRLGSGFKPPRDADKGLLIVTPNGKAEGYYVDRELADTWLRNPDQAAMITRFVRDVCSFVRQLFVSKNVGWIVVNPIRDAMGTYKNLPKASIRKLTMAYIDTFVDAFRAGFGKWPEIEKKMLEAKMIVMDRQFRGRDVESEFAQEEKLLSYGTSPVRWRNFVLKAVNGVLNFLDKLGKAGERHGKFAGYRYLTKYEPERGEKEIGHIVRTRVGTPNIYARGLAHNFTNNIYLFSNVNMQGYRASLESYKEAPGAYIYRTIAWNILPKAMARAALAGFLGAELKEIFEKVPKYYRRMYNIIPLGLTPGGNAAIITLPQDYTGQVVGGIFDAIFSGEMIGGTGALGIATEQSPYNLNPILSTAGNIGAYYLLKANPMNYHYAQNVLTEQEYKAGGMAAMKGLAREAWNDLGGPMLWRWKRDHVEGVEEEIKDLLGIFPLNSIGRFIRVVNTGEKETARDITEKVGQEEAKKHLQVRERIIRAINEGGKATRDMTTLYRELKKENLISDGLSVGQFRHTFNRYLVKSGDNPKLEAISQAGTNEQKAALLEYYQKTLTPEDFNRIKKAAIKEGFVSDEALIIMRKNQRKKESNA